MTWTLLFLLEVHKLANVEYQRLMEYRERPMVVQEETAQPMEKTTLEKPASQPTLAEDAKGTHSMNSLTEFQ